MERQLQLKTQQQFTKEYLEAKGLKDDPGQPGQVAGVEKLGTPLPMQAEQPGFNTEGDGEFNHHHDGQLHPADEEQEDDDDDEDDEDEEDEEVDYAKLPQVDTILYREAQQPPPTSPPQTQGLQASFVPVQSLATQQSTDFSTADYLDSPDLQRAMVSQQQMLGQHLTGLGPGLLTQAPDGLMVATPAQTLTDTLDDIMAGV